MSGKAKPPQNIIENAQLVMKVLRAYQYYDEGLTSERELRQAIVAAIAGADMPLLVTALAHSTIESMKRSASAKGVSLSQILEDVAAELRPFIDLDHPPR
ncbi:hypothetical protein ACX80W_06470 [Arthrobacter sp. TMN-37]